METSSPYVVCVALDPMYDQNFVFSTDFNKKNMHTFLYGLSSLFSRILEG
jgi:hypothetical protein